MKKSVSQKVRLGVFVIFSNILFVAAVYFIGQGQDMFKKTFTVSAFFQNVNGLQHGNNVRYSGIDIGTVRAIKMINDSTIKIDMTIDDKIIKHIKKDAIATIGSDGLVGNMIVNIVPGNRKEVAIKNGDTIASYSKIGADDILSTLSVGSENAALLTVDLLKITSAMLEGEGTIGLLLNDTVMAQDLKRSVYHLKMASRGASRTIDELNDIVASLKTSDDTILGMVLNDTVTADKMKSIIDHLEVSSGEINNILAQIDSVVSDFNSSEGAYHYMVKDSVLVKNLEEIIKNINEGTDKFNQNMEALKHNFLTRGYFRKLEREKKKAEKAKAN